MTDRDADAEKLAVAMEWRYLGENYPFMPNAEGAFVFVEDERNGMETWIHVPAADAPLGDKLGFVGRLAEQLGPGSLRFVRMIPVPTVCFHPGGGRVPCPSSAPDLVHAAIRAALAAKWAT